MPEQLMFDFVKPVTYLGVPADLTIEDRTEFKVLGTYEISGGGWLTVYGGPL